MGTGKRSYTKVNRPAQAGELVGVRLQPDLLALVDVWRADQPGRMSRPEAMRSLIVHGLICRQQPAHECIAGDPILPDELISHEALGFGSADDVLIPFASPENAEGDDPVEAEPSPSISSSHEFEIPAMPRPAKSPVDLGPLGAIKLTSRPRPRR